MSSYQSLSRIVKPKHLFYFLVKKLEPDLVLDVGSRDGSDSLEMRRASPRSEIIAFEANPELFAKMSRDPRLAAQRIGIRNAAISDATGEGRFLIFNETKGMGSLLPSSRREESEQPSFTVPTLRLDEVEEARRARSIALWIDVEGCSYQVVEGASGILDRVSLIQAEVEYGEFWKDQKLAADLRTALEQRGFVQVFERIKSFKQQGNAIYARQELVSRLSGFGRVAEFAATRALTGISRTISPS